MSKSSPQKLADPTLANPTEGAMIIRTQVAAAAPIWVKERLLGTVREAAVVCILRYRAERNLDQGD